MRDEAVCWSFPAGEDAGRYKKRAGRMRVSFKLTSPCHFDLRALVMISAISDSLSGRKPVLA